MFLQIGEAVEHRQMDCFLAFYKALTSVANMLILLAIVHNRRVKLRCSAIQPTTSALAMEWPRVFLNYRRPVNQKPSAEQGFPAAGKPKRGKKMKRVLTDRTIAALQPGRIVHDALVPGLSCRATRHGHRTFLFCARYPGAKHFTRRALGHVGRMTLAQAREAARAWLAELAAGHDPTQTQQPSPARAPDTFARVAEQFIARKLPSQRRGERVAREIRKELLPHWGTRPITEITRRDVRELIRAIVARPAPRYAHNIFNNISAVFSFAMNEDILEISPTFGLRPRQLIGEKRVRERVLDNDEIIALWNATEPRCSQREHRHYPWGALARLLLLTGARLNEVARATWEEIDFDRRTLTVPAARFKQNAVHTIPLSDDAMTCLRGLPRFTGPYVFTNRAGEKPVVNFGLRAKQALDRAMGNPPHWVIHDLRRTVRTRLAELRIPEHIAELVIGHSKRGLQRVYNRHEYSDEIRAALEAWAARLRAIVDPSEPSNVVRLTG